MAKLVVVVHDLAHQLLDHLLTDKTLLDGCNGLRTRSLKPRRVAVSNRPTVTPLSRAQLLHQVQTRRIRHHPPVNSNSPSTG